jgi:hypothetical protein
MGRLFTNPDPLVDDLMTVVGRSGIPYYCPDRAAFAQHLADLCRRLQQGRRFAALVRIYRDDIDTLLDCRELLELVAFAEPAGRRQVRAPRADAAS